jgi:hypothetical protein
MREWAHCRNETPKDNGLRSSHYMILLDAPFVVNDSLEHKTVSVIGEMGMPASTPDIAKLIAEKIVSHSAITKRAYEILPIRARRLCRR